MLRREFGAETAAKWVNAAELSAHTAGFDTSSPPVVAIPSSLPRCHSLELANAADLALNAAVRHATVEPFSSNRGANVASSPVFELAPAIR